MRKIILTFGLFTFICLITFGQQIHTSAEIFKIMGKSPISYELAELETVIAAPDRTENLNYNHYYRVIENNQLITYKYEESEEVSIYLKKAEKFFSDRQFQDAREMYLKVLELDSTYYEVMTYVGQTYGIEKDFEKAIEWYTKTIELNYIDYMAHWFLADAYKVQGEIEKAVNEITIAQILNRNNPRINKSLNEIYNLEKINNPSWIFNPQIQIDSVGINKVKIAFHLDWLGYAMVKALWLYEPQYKESMGVENGSFSTLHEKECFVSLMSTFTKKKLKRYPEFKALKLALDKDMITEYIFYEIYLMDYPFIAYQLPEEFIENIKSYVIKIRSKTK
jgi:tetratricopeptide (TPR) repeat protein